MEDVLKLKIRFRRSTASDWTTKNPVLLSGEPAVETDTGKFKIGDGIKTWTALPYVGGEDSSAFVQLHNQSPTAHLDIRYEVASKVDNADARLTDDRTPKPHNHAQSDVTGLSTALTTLSTTLASKVDNADARLTDDRTPKPHNHAQSDVTGLSTALTTLTTSVASKVDNADARLTDDRTPTAHAASHGSGGSDAVTVAQSQVTGLTSALAGKETAGAAAAAQAASQPLDSDLTAISALSTTAWGRQLLTIVDHATARTTLGLGTAATQASGAFATAAHIHDASDVTSGLLATARVASGTATPGFIPTVGESGALELREQIAHNPTLYSAPWWVTDQGSAGAANNYSGLSGVGYQVWVPVFLAPGTYDRIAVLSTIAAAATWRLGIDECTKNFIPGVNLIDAGVVDLNAAPGIQALTISFVLTTPKWVFLRAKCETFTANPTVHCVTGISSSQQAFQMAGWPMNIAIPGRSLVAMQCVINAGSGPFVPPPTFNGNIGTGVGYSQSAARIFLRRSA